MFVSLLSQAAYYVPSVLAHLVALGVAAALLPRARVPAQLLGVGTLFQLAASAMSFGTSCYTTAAYQRGDAETAGMVGPVFGILASCARAVGELGVVAAVGMAVWRPTTADGRDPYGFDANPPG